MTERDLQRWSREVAEDPGAPSFVRLARAYRRQGRRDAARDVVLAGLEANPEHVGGHGLLALLHVEAGERQQAGDEWETVMRLDPGNFEANRGLGFLALERGDFVAARRHLEAAGRARSDDPAVAQALQVLARREKAEAGGRAVQPQQEAESAERGAAAQPGTNPVRLFDGLSGEGPFRGALVLDDQGLVLAGRLEDGEGRADLLGGLLNAAVSEASRTTDVLRLGGWEGLLLETEKATIHLTEAGRGAVVVVVADPGAPAGWVLRTAERAREMAARFMEAHR